VEYCNWYVISNLAVTLLVTSTLLWLVLQAYVLPWYWVLAAGFVLFWGVAFFIERHPLGTYLLRKFFRE
jgi:hypothetical protein